jgi:hypothetical protein
MLAVDDDNLTAQACLYYRDETGRQQRAELDPSRSHLTIGRGEADSHPLERDPVPVITLRWDLFVTAVEVVDEKQSLHWETAVAMLSAAFGRVPSK